MEGLDATAVGKSARGSKSKRRRLVAGAVVLVLAALAVSWFLLGLKELVMGEGGTLKGPSEAPFTIKYPKGWQPASDKELQSMPGGPLAVLRNDEKEGVLIVRLTKRAPANFVQLSKQLPAELAKRFTDFQKRSTKTIKTRAGDAFYFSYIRKQKGTIHTVTVIPKGSRSYEIDTVSKGSARKAAFQIAKMIVSFNVPN